MKAAQPTSLPQELQISAYNRDEGFAAAFLGVTIGAMRTWRKKRCGPPWRKIGKLVRYSLADLKQWVESQPAGGGKAA